MGYDCSCDYDMPTVYSQNFVRAKKAYRCDECRHEIKPGERYEYTFGVWDGSAGSFHTCSDCVDRRQWVRNNLPCFCWAHGNLLSDINDAIQYAYDYARDEVRGLAFGYGRLLVKQSRARAA